MKKFFVELLKHKLLIRLVGCEFLLILAIEILSHFKYIPKNNWILILPLLLLFIIMIYIWKLDIEKTSIQVLCATYLVYIVIPPLFPTLAIGGIFDFSLPTTVIIYILFIVILLCVQLYYLVKQTKNKSNSVKVKIFEKMKAASGFSIPIFGLVSVLRIYWYDSKGILFLINSFLFVLVILSIHRGLIELFLYNLKFPSESENKMDI